MIGCFKMQLSPWSRNKTQASRRLQAFLSQGNSVQLNMNGAVQVGSSYATAGGYV
ncbi:hypothetical protein V6Z11_D03G100200 [Gossypium hirsutum]